MAKTKCTITQVLTCKTAYDLRTGFIKKVRNLPNWTLKLYLDKLERTSREAARLADSSTARSTIWINPLNKSTLCTPNLCTIKQTSPQKKALVSISLLFRSRTLKRIFSRPMRYCMNTLKCKSRLSSSKVLMRERLQKWREVTQRRLRNEVQA